MQDQTKQISDNRERLLERAVVSQILREDRPDGWQGAELATEIGDAGPIAIRNVLARLEQEGVVQFADERIVASRAAIRLNELDMIAV